MMVNDNPAQKFYKEGLTFDDVLLIPAASECSAPSDLFGHPAHKENPPEHPAAFFCYGHRYRV